VNYNLPDKTDGLFCKEHASTNMTNVRASKCIEQNCTNYPIYNY
jgi:hypothetical protein